MSDEDAFAALRSHRVAIFGSGRRNEFRFQIIRHGPFTRTQGAHLHLGLAPAGFGGLRGFIVEGLQPEQRGYRVVEAP